MDKWQSIQAVLCSLLAVTWACAHTRPSDELSPELGGEVAAVMIQHHAHDTAIPLLRRAIAHNPNDANLHRMMGIVLRDRDLYREAIVELLLAWHFDAHNADTAAALGILYDKRGNQDAAQMWHQQAIDLNPHKAEYFNNLGFTYSLHRRDWPAIAAFREALRLHPGLRRAANNLGFVLARQHLMQEAYAAFVQGSTEKGQALANVGLAYELAKDQNGALYYYRLALQQNRGLQSVAVRLRYLTEHVGVQGDLAPTWSPTPTQASEANAAGQKQPGEVPWSTETIGSKSPS